jgi:CAAX amino terminal protease family.
MPTPYISSTQPLRLSEKIAGLIYLPLHIFVLPIFMGIFSQVSPGTLTDIQREAAYFLCGVIFVIVFFRDFLRRGFDVFMDNKLRSLMSITSTYFINIILTYGSLSVAMIFFGDFQIPEELNPALMSKSGILVLAGLGIFAASLVDEVIFRGVVFGVLRSKNRVLAYVVSILLFTVYHTWQIWVIMPDMSVLIYTMQFIPLGYTLVLCYERSGSIWAPVFSQMIMNALAFSSYL